MKEKMLFHSLFTYRCRGLCNQQRRISPSSTASKRQPKKRAINNQSHLWTHRSFLEAVLNIRKLVRKTLSCYLGCRDTLFSFLSLACRDILSSGTSFYIFYLPLTCWFQRLTKKCHANKKETSVTPSSSRRPAFFFRFQSLDVLPCNTFLFFLFFLQDPEGVTRLLLENQLLTNERLQAAGSS